MPSSKSLTLPAIFDNIGQLCEFIMAAATQVGFNERDLFRLQLACDEACTNIVEHAYGKDRNGDIKVTWQVDETHFIMSFFDTGQPFEPENIPEPHLPDNTGDLTNLPIGGLGLSIIRKIMDEVIFEFRDAGNTLHLKKRLPTA
jgi:serine/threonine-protein kinase RsbW